MLVSGVYCSSSTSVYLQKCHHSRRRTMLSQCDGHVPRAVRVIRVTCFIPGNLSLLFPLTITTYGVRWVLD